MAPLLTSLKTNRQRLPAVMKRADVAVCTHVIHHNHGGAVRACSRLLHVPARQTWQRKAGKSPPLQLKKDQIKPHSAVRSEGLTRLGPGMVQDWDMMTRMTGFGYQGSLLCSTSCASPDSDW